MQTTLQLLQGPTRLLVGSALTGLAAELALTSRQPAHCYVFKPTYDDEAFQVIPMRCPPLPWRMGWPRCPKSTGGGSRLAPRVMHPLRLLPLLRAAALQSIYGSSTQQALASSKPKRPVGVVALRKLTAPGNMAVIVGRK